MDCGSGRSSDRMFILLACGKREKSCERESVREREAESERERERTNQKQQAITVSRCDSTQEAVSAAPGTVAITLGKEEEGVVGGEAGLHSK